MGPELRLYTRCEEWSRCEPSSRINAGECISGGEEVEEAREHLASRRTHRRTEERRQRGHHVWCQRRERERELKFLSRLSCTPVWCIRPCTYSRRARGRRTHTWYVRVRGMRGNRHLLSSGNLAPGKLRRDDGFPPIRSACTVTHSGKILHPRVGKMLQGCKERFVYFVLCSQTKVIRKRKDYLYQETKNTQLFAASVELFIIVIMYFAFSFFLFYVNRTYLSICSAIL